MLPSAASVKGYTCSMTGAQSSGAGADLHEQVVARLRGYEEAAAVRAAELRAMTEDEAARIADDLLALLPLLADEPDRGSGLVEQQRLFRLVRQ